MPHRPHPLKNKVLAALSLAEQQQIFPDLELVPLPVGVASVSTVDVRRNLYFPAGCVVSLMYPIGDRRQVEVAVVDTDGIIGVGLMLGDEVVPPAPVVQRPGPAYRLPDRRLKDASPESLALRLKILEYSQGLLSRMILASICRRTHSIEQRLSRWLLKAMDYRDTPEVDATHRSIGNLLAVHADTVGRAARRLELAGAIARRWRQIDVLNRQLLESMSCDCYAEEKREIELTSSIA